MDKPSLIKKIKALDTLTNSEKADLIALLNNTKKYGLVWEDKPEDVERDLLTMLPILQEVPEKRILASDIVNVVVPPVEVIKSNIGEGTLSIFPEETNIDSEFSVSETIQSAAPNHILIEGDNLHALTALTFTHQGRIDLIYIDPPYNTGQDNEFRYNDKWILKEDPFKHSTWVSFISKRLWIAKRLLDEKGVIIIHIDENEFDALNLLMESEIFSEDSFLGVIVWNKQNPKGDAKGVASMHEYLLVYAKNKFEFNLMENALMRPKPNALQILNKAKRIFSKLGKTDIPEEIKEVIKPFNFSREILEDFKVQYDLALINKEFQSWINRQDFSGGEKAYKIIDQKGKVYQSVSMAWPNKEKAPEEYFIPLVHPLTGKECPVPARGWRNPPKTMQDLLNKNLVLFGVDEKTQPRRKYLLEENLFENTPSIYNNGSSDDELFKEMGINFPYPKPVDVASYFLKCIHPKPKIILDFFAGSGTTLHATMALNAEDRGNRQCILITNNENNICEEVTYERNKRVIQGFTNAKGLPVPGLTNNNLRYFKTGFVPSAKTETNRRLLTRASSELLQIKENCYTDITSANGFDPAKCCICTNGSGKYLVIVFHSRRQHEVIEQLCRFIQNIPDLLDKVRVYAFSPETEVLVDDFYSVADRINAVPLPDAIYNAYRATFKTLKLEKKKFATTPDVQEEIGSDDSETDSQPELFDQNGEE